MWEANDDVAKTIHFNCDREINNIFSVGNEFNYIVRSYGARQQVIDEKYNLVIRQQIN
jgi:hypothetical protein